MNKVTVLLATQLALVACLSLDKAALLVHPSDDNLKGAFTDPMKGNYAGRVVELNPEYPGTVFIKGKDTAEDEEWSVKGAFSRDRNTVTVDWSSRGGPVDLQGKVTDKGIEWPEGFGFWPKRGFFGDDKVLQPVSNPLDWHPSLPTPTPEQAMGIEGVFADPTKGDGAARYVELDDDDPSKIFVRGKESENSKEWELEGNFNKAKGEIRVDMSPVGGAKNTLGKVTPDGIQWPTGLWPKKGYFDSHDDVVPLPGVDMPHDDAWKSAFVP